MPETTVAFHTLGCKLNYSESSTLQRMLQADGMQVVGFGHAADIYVINTCSVTENADKECRSVIRKVQRLNPDARIAVVGCYAQLKPEAIAALPGVDLVLGAREKFELGKYLRSLPEKKQAGVAFSCEVSEAVEFHSSYSIGERTRAFLKVQDGCNYTCSYCTIPMARGASRSDKIDQVVHQARLLGNEGIQEVVLTGINLGDFGIQKAGSLHHEESFTELALALEQVDAIHRFRISSIEPNLLSSDLIAFVAGSRRFMPHFHIPLQSGSNKILKLMRRRYQRELYADRVGEIRRQIPHAAIGADVIVGFPGETQQDFLETYRFLQELDLNYLHVFTYSERPGTDALLLPGAVPLPVRQERNRMLRILSEKKRVDFYSRQVGTERAVLLETASQSGFLEGYTDNYIKVRVPYEVKLERSLQWVRLMPDPGETMIGQLLPAPAAIRTPVLS